LLIRLTVKDATLRNAAQHPERPGRFAAKTHKSAALPRGVIASNNIS